MRRWSSSLSPMPTALTITFRHTPVIDSDRRYVSRSSSHHRITLAVMSTPNPFEHYSIIKMIQTKFALNNATYNPLWTSARDQSIADLATSLAQSTATSTSSSSSTASSAYTGSALSSSSHSSSSSLAVANVTSSTGTNAATAQFSAVAIVISILALLTVLLIRIIKKF